MSGGSASAQLPPCSPILHKTRESVPGLRGLGFQELPSSPPAPGSSSITSEPAVSRWLFGDRPCPAVGRGL